MRVRSVELNGVRVRYAELIKKFALLVRMRYVELNEVRVRSVDLNEVGARSAELSRNLAVVVRLLVGNISMFPVI